MEDARPLLAPQTDGHPEQEDNGPVRRTAPAKATIGSLLALLLLVNLATSLYSLPLNRVIERRLCREHYQVNDPSGIGRGGSVPEELCKIDAVQQGLAWILGAMETISIVAGESRPAQPGLTSRFAPRDTFLTSVDFLMTIPLGFLAEKYGHRAILWLNLVPRVFMLAWAIIVGCFEHSVPTKAFIVGPALSLLGGDCVFNAITYSLAAGITDDAVLR